MEKIYQKVKVEESTKVFVYGFDTGWKDLDDIESRINNDMKSNGYQPISISTAYVPDYSGHDYCNTLVVTVIGEKIKIVEKIQESSDNLSEL